MEETHLTGGEWRVMSCLWKESPQTLMALVAALKESAGWSKSTTITTLRRMEAKGLVRCVQTPRGKSYSPAVEQSGAAAAATRSFLDRVYEGSIGLMMSAMAQRREISAEDIAELRAILDAAEGRTSS